MNLAERVGLRVLHRLDPEVAHSLSIMILRARLAPMPGPVTSARLKTSIAGITLANPVGLAAGFDKNARAVAPLARSGFGFLELGAATPKAQPGNPKPRLFRLPEDRGVINRFGFNNDGAEAICERLARTPTAIPRGLNLGANKDSDDRAQDFVSVLKMAAPSIDFATVNVSSPNTERLRDLQGPKALAALLGRVTEARDGLTAPLPVFLKIAPDLSDDELAAIAKVANASGIDAIIATNTTLSRQGLKSSAAAEAGGLSGAPLFGPSTRVLARLSRLTDLPLIGVGGISSAREAYAKIRAGASAVQLYSAMVWGGLSLAADIARGLDDLLKADGYDNVADAVGSDVESWL